MAALPRVAVVGAGSSGITALKALHEAGLPVVAYEKGDRVGGNWVFRNSNGMSSSYRSLHINTSRERMEYSDFPMPKDYPDFPHHSHVAEYFGSYVERFGLQPLIRFGTGVERAERQADGTWRVVDDRGGDEVYDALVVANGHHWDPRWPDPAYPGQDAFPGEQLHAHHFEDNTGWRDKVVVVVGMGNSAMDIAVEASWVAKDVYLAARTPAHVLPKYVFGRPLDQLQKGAAARLPWRVRQRATEAILKVAVGRYEAYGLRTPEHGVFQAHPTVSDTILSRMAHGKVHGKPGPARFEGDEVVFTDGSRVRADVVVWCTGYKISFPFFGEAERRLVVSGDNEVELYERVFPLQEGAAGLALVGLVQPLGAMMPLAEEQGRLVADWLRGRYALPPVDAMRAEVARYHREVRERYVGSKRHTVQVDFDVYLHELQQERRRGRKRAAQAGYPLPLPARAAQPA